MLSNAMTLRLEDLKEKAAASGEAGNVEDYYIAALACFILAADAGNRLAELSGFVRDYLGLQLGLE